MWWCGARDSADAKPAERSLKGKSDSARQRDYCPFTMVVGMERLGATGGASKARMPEMNAQRLCRTQSQQSVHKEARMP